MHDDPARADPSTRPIDDDRLRLVFTCCHPALSMEARVALTLKVVSNLSTAAIGRVFLTSENTMGQRLLRAKQQDRQRRHPLPRAAGRRAPRTPRRRARRDLPRVHRGLRDGADDDLADEAIRLGRLLVELMPGLRRGTRAARPDAAPARPARRPRRRRRAGDARGPGPVAVGHRRDQRGARADRRRRGRPRAVPHPGRPRRRARHRARRRVDGLAAHRRPLRRAAGGPPVTGRRASTGRSPSA